MECSAPVAAALLRVDPDGSAHEVADELKMANGMVITGDHSTLLVAESWGKCITAFDLANDGSLSNRRMWADLPDYADGIGIDAQDAVWAASPVSDRFIRVVEGGEVTRAIDAGGRHAIACEVGGTHGRTLFMVTATMHGGRAESRQALGPAVDVVAV